MKNLIVEIIDGVAYAVEEGDGCSNCEFVCEQGCKKQVGLVKNMPCLKYETANRYYRRLTPEERVELTKAIGRGMG